MNPVPWEGASTASRDRHARSLRPVLGAALLVLAACGGSGGGGTGGIPGGGGGGSGGEPVTLFFDDFSSGISSAWSAPNLDVGSGVPGPSVRLFREETAQYVGPFFNTFAGLTIQVDAQYDSFQRFLFQIFDQAQPDGRSVAFEGTDGELLIEYREGGTVILEGRFPIPPNDRKFHQYKIVIDSQSQASFFYDGDFYMATPFPPSVAWMSFTSHSYPATPLENLVRIDNVKVTVP